MLNGVFNAEIHLSGFKNLTDDKRKQFPHLQNIKFQLSIIVKNQFFD